MLFRSADPRSCVATTKTGTERGENEGSAGAFYSTLKANKPDWLRDGKLRLLMQCGAAPRAIVDHVADNVAAV